MSSATQNRSQIEEIVTPSKNSLSFEENLFKNRKRLFEILQLMSGGECQERIFTFIATVLKVDTNSGWYYMSCDCRKKVRESGATFWCDKCEREVQYPIPVYKLVIEVQDFTGTATLVVFDKQVEQLLRYPAHEDCPVVVLQKLELLIRRMFVFQIKLNEFNFEKGMKKFTVQKVYNANFRLECRHLLQSTPKVSTIRNESDSQDKFSVDLATPPNEIPSKKRNEEVKMNANDCIIPGKELFTEESPAKKICNREFVVSVIIIILPPGSSSSFLLGRRRTTIITVTISSLRKMFFMMSSSPPPSPTLTILVWVKKLTRLKLEVDELISKSKLRSL